jgi:DNA-binding response OmpR family regulator
MYTCGGVRQKILIVEDNPMIMEFMEVHLRREQFEVITAEGCTETLSLLKRHQPELIVLDVVLDDGLGYDLCRTIRAGGTDGSLAPLIDVPIVMLTARADQQDRLAGLQAGADDYVTKPFSVEELVLRIRAILRRSAGVSHGLIDVDVLRLDPRSREVTVGGQALNLTQKEFDLLHVLVSNPGRVFPREELLARIWGYTYIGNSRTVDVHVNTLRQKLAVYPNADKLITTEWGLGYKFIVS